ncbi:MAG: SGNH/GDSL hydrolase family protein [Solirubrobacterales bacterium]|nr:SGNH/GDSL hydrolase family protein [Solirubrobacterales bacterium]
MTEHAVYRRFVAIGDSQTEGVGDPTGPGGTERGWADRFAEGLARLQPDGQLLYANLAIRGRLIAQIEEEQFEPALAMEPDLISLIGGMNDVIRPGCDVDAVLGCMDGMQQRAAATGATILTITYPDPTNMTPVGKLVSERMAEFNRGLREIAARHGSLLLDIEPIAAATDPRIWCDDRLHLNTGGHIRMALGMALLLDRDAEASELFDDLPPREQAGRIRQAGRDLHWAGAFFVPWIGRRLTGRSSGDGRAAKRPRLMPV